MPTPTGSGWFCTDPPRQPDRSVSRTRTTRPELGRVDIFRLNEDGKIIEHWDVLQQIPETTASGNDMFSQLT